MTRFNYQAKYIIVEVDQTDQEATIGVERQMVVLVYKQNQGEHEIHNTVELT